MRVDPAIARRFLEGGPVLDWEVYRQIAAALAATLTPRARVRERDALFRAAAAKLPPGPPWSQARALRREMLATLRSFDAGPTDHGTLRGILRSAILMTGKVPCERSIYRALIR